MSNRMLHEQIVYSLQPAPEGEKMYEQDKDMTHVQSYITRTDWVSTSTARKRKNK